MVEAVTPGLFCDILLDVPSDYANCRTIFISDAISMGMQRLKTGDILAARQARRLCHDDRSWNRRSDHAYRREFGSSFAPLAIRNWNDHDSTYRTRRDEWDPVPSRRRGWLRSAFLRFTGASIEGSTALMARNFGVSVQTVGYRRPSSWPLLPIALIALGLMNVLTHLR
jgi:hypothetical protein